MKSYFVAYPAANPIVKRTLMEFVTKLNNKGKSKAVAWEQLGVPGSFIRDKVLEQIDKSDLFIADISLDNFNVIFEIGYAIGSGKPIILLKNDSIENPNDGRVDKLGIYDTIGFQPYTSSKDLVQAIPNLDPNPLIKSAIKKRNTKSPVYILDTKHKTEFSTRVTARVKKERLSFRAFDPNETSRLSASDVISQVYQSLGVLVQLVHSSIKDHDIHNLRASFVAGLATGMDRTLCLMQFGIDPVPIDFRDFTQTFHEIDQIDEIIQAFARDVMENLQDIDADVQMQSEDSSLEELDFGAGSAENEMRTLHDYYLKTDEFRKAARGEVQVVVGRKGSGKSAVFIQLRDRERSKSGNIVLDLKPEGYRLIKFKEQVLNFLEAGTMHHTIMAFWEYILLLEIALKILVKDKNRHKNDPDLFESYTKLRKVIHDEKYNIDGDFSERLQSLLNKISSKYNKEHGKMIKGKLNLSAPEITKLLHTGDIQDLRSIVIQYLKYKKSTWILFDNIDKGWPTNGLTEEDLIIIRTLIDSTSRLKRSFDKENLELNPVIFLRNDVFELLVESTSDKGKESKVVLDWTDKDLLKELVKLRILSSWNSNRKNKTEPKTASADEVWSLVCVKKFGKHGSLDFLVDQCLMRPRFLINLLNQCKSQAVNLGHKRINEDDIKKALASYSSDLLVDISYEIKDVMPAAESVLYSFIGSSSMLNKSELLGLIENHLPEEKIDDVIDILLWYGFLGLEIKGEDKYIYHHNYKMQLFRGLIKNKGDDVIFKINPTFWPSLMINT